MSNMASLSNGHPSLQWNGKDDPELIGPINLRSTLLLNVNLPLGLPRENANEISNKNVGGLRSTRLLTMNQLRSLPKKDTQEISSKNPGEPNLGPAYNETRSEENTHHLEALKLNSLSELYTTPVATPKKLGENPESCDGKDGDERSDDRSPGTSEGGGRLSSDSDDEVEDEGDPFLNSVHHVPLEGDRWLRRRPEDRAETKKEDQNESSSEEGDGRCRSLSPCVARLRRIITKRKRDEPDIPETRKKFKGVEISDEEIH